MSDNLVNIISALIKEIDLIVEEKVNSKLKEVKNTIIKKQNDFMTVKEAAIHLSISQKTIYKYVQVGKLNHYKPNQCKDKLGNESSKNTKLYFKKEELDKYLMNKDYHYFSHSELESQVQTKRAIKKI